MWRNRNVWLILTGELVAGLGLWLGIIGNLEFLQRHVSSDFLKSLILFTGLLAGVMVGPMAGKVIDRYRKKTVLLYAGFFRMVSVILMMAALHFSSIGWMIGFMVAIQVSASFYFPALQAAIPLIVKEKDLLAMNGIHMNVSTVARILGTALGGALLVVMSLRSLYVFSMIAYGFLFLSTFFLQIHEEVKQESKLRPAASFKEIIPILKQHALVKMTLILSIVPTLFLGGFNLMIMNVSELQHDPTIKGILYTVEGTCFMIGAFIVKRLAAKWDLRKMMFAFSLFIAVAHLSLYFANIKITSMLSFAMFGLGVGCFFPITATIFQTNVPKEYHGRFFSFKNMFDRMMFQIVLLGTGLLLDTIGLSHMVIVFGTISCVLILYFFTKETKQQSYFRNQDQDSSA
jgi:MFS family permease